MNTKPTMHCQNEIVRDTGYVGFLPDATMMKWFHDQYSTSRHLLTLYSVALGLQAKTILEIGFGRSSFVLARAASENKGRFISCDMRDFSYLFSKEEMAISTFHVGMSNAVWSSIDTGIDFAFLDYFSSEEMTLAHLEHEISMCISFLKTNSIIAVHDSMDPRYKVREVITALRVFPEIEYVSLPYNYGLALIRYTGNSHWGRIEDNCKKKP